MSTFGLVAYFGFLFFCAGYGFGRDRERWRWQERELYRAIGVNPKSFDRCGRSPQSPEGNHRHPRAQPFPGGRANR